ncbi:MAG TPA: hypothetical protein VII56_17080 [Rhizomicrobium sp.]
MDEHLSVMLLRFSAARQMKFANRRLAKRPFIFICRSSSWQVRRDCNARGFGFSGEAAYSRGKSAKLALKLADGLQKIGA